VKVKAAFAIAAVFTFGREGTSNGLGGPFVLFLAVASCFIMDALAHLVKEAVRGVSATSVEFGYPAAAAAAMAEVLVLAFTPVGRVGVGVVASMFAEVYYGAGRGYFGLYSGSEEAFSSAQIAVAPVGSKAKVGISFGVEQVIVRLDGIGKVAKCGCGRPVVISTLDDNRERGPQNIKSVWWDEVYPDD